MSPALILTYHAVESGPPPLCVAPGLFREHVDVLADSGAQSVTVAGLADRLRSGASPDGLFAITFDDGFASVVREAVPLLADRGLTATVFCVAGHLGRTNDWSTQPARTPRRALATSGELAALAAEGFEIGSHGTEHVPLHSASKDVLERELLESKELIGGAVGQPVTSLAYPYGVEPQPIGRELVKRSFSAACTGQMNMIRSADDPLALPRIDAHYLRRPELLRRALGGSLGPYLGLRRLGARARRVLREDYVERPA